MGEIRALRNDPGAAGGLPAAAHTPVTSHKAPITPHDTMAQAAQKTLWRTWKRARDAEAGARRGGDIEGVHDLRVAVRRTRVALRIFRKYLDRDAVRPFRGPLRRTARALGAVRDLDVFEEKTRRYLDALPAGQRTELNSLLAAWKGTHARARAHLAAWLDSPKFARLSVEFREWVRNGDPETGPPAAHGEAAERVRDVVPIVLLGDWTAVRAYDESVARRDVPLEELHRLRIACKRLRYTLEFFTAALGEGAERLVAEVTHVQDHLGNLQDAVVACEMLQSFLACGGWRPDGHAPRHHPPSPLAPGVAAYLDARQREIRTLVETFPEAWAPVRSTEFKKQLLALIADW